MTMRPVPRFLSASFAAVRAEAAQAVQGWLGAAPPEVIVAELGAFAEAEDSTPALGALLSGAWSAAHGAPRNVGLGGTFRR